MLFPSKVHLFLHHWPSSCCFQTSLPSSGLNICGRTLGCSHSWWWNLSLSSPWSEQCEGSAGFLRKWKQDQRIFKKCQQKESGQAERMRIWLWRRAVSYFQVDKLTDCMRSSCKVARWSPPGKQRLSEGRGEVPVLLVSKVQELHLKCRAQTKVSLDKLLKRESRESFYSKIENVSRE